MAINTINSFNGYVSSGMALISEETRRKLIALGIDPANVTSEAQARTLIEQAENARKAENTPKNLQTQNQSNQSTSEVELISKAKQLAQKIGINLSENLSLDDILKVIAAEISNGINSASSSDEKEKYMEYDSELNSIKSGYSTISHNQEVLTMTMDYNAFMNKMILGL